MRPLLNPEIDPEPFEIEEGEGNPKAFMTVDHAGNAVPEALGDLGLAGTDLERHIGYDIGIAGVSRELARLLNIPAIYGNYSRLVVDLNRNPHKDASLIPEVSDGTAVPGNQSLPDEARVARLSEIYWPYHTAIESELDALTSTDNRLSLICMHSMTQKLANSTDDDPGRPWHVSVLWEWDDRLARPLLAALRALPDVEVGENVPYSGRQAEGITARWHGARRHLPHVILEIRQDLIDTPEKQLQWAKRLAPAFEVAMEQAMKLDPQTELEIQAAAYRRLVAHLRERTDVQNIDLMNLAGFCRNCLSKWTMAEAQERGLEMDYDAAREYVYGMAYSDWKDRYQSEASAEQKQAFEDNKHA